MSIRTTETLATFRHPFKLSCFETLQPPGTYVVATEEEQIVGLSFSAYRRISTTLYTPDRSSNSGTRQAYSVDPDELQRALDGDRRPPGAQI